MKNVLHTIQRVDEGTRNHAESTGKLLRNLQFRCELEVEPTQKG